VTRKIISTIYKCCVSLYLHRNIPSLYKMDLIQNYASEESFTEVSNDCELKPRQLRSVYLVTYSQADLEKFPSRAIFAETVANFFTSTNVKVVQWACSMEEHEITGGYHYHMCLKLNMNKRWMPVKQKMSQEYGVQLHFSSAHINYYSAWKYTTKSDKNFIQSEKHPDLTQETSPRTKAATSNRIRNKKNKIKPSKKKLLTQPQVSNIIRTKQIKTKPLPNHLNALSSLLVKHTPFVLDYNHSKTKVFSLM